MATIPAHVRTLGLPEFALPANPRSPKLGSMDQPAAPDVTLIAAVSEDGIIGTGCGGLPWRLPRDAAHFRASVGGKAILLGRITYGEMRGWFRDERPIVLTSNPAFPPREAGTRVARSLSNALATAAAAGEPELMVCGGASVYAQALPLATRMILTHVDLRIARNYPDPVRFPAYDPEDWSIAGEQAFAADPENSAGMRIVNYRRSAPPGHATQAGQSPKNSNSW